MALSLGVFGGCATSPKTPDVAVHVGMSRSELKLYFGEPLRTEPAASGGENWYYRFITWKNGPTGSAGTFDDFGDRTSFASAGWSFTRETDEEPIHVSADGFVTDPLPRGKITH